MSVHPSIVQQGGAPSPGLDRPPSPSLQAGTETAFAAAMEAWLALLQPLSGPLMAGGGSGSGQSPGPDGGAKPPPALLPLQGWMAKGPVGPWPVPPGAPGEAGEAGQRPPGPGPVTVGPPSAGEIPPVHAPTPGVERLSWQAAVPYPGPVDRPQPGPEGAGAVPLQLQTTPVRPPTESTVESAELLRPGSGAEPAPIPSGNVAVAADPVTVPLDPPRESLAPSPSPASQIADQVQTLLERGERQATLRLNPPDLGRVHIRLELQDGRLHLAIRTEHLETGRLIDQRLTELRHGLETRGLHLGDVRVHAEALNGLGEAPRGLLRSVPMDLGGDLARQGQPHPEAFGAMADGGSPGRPSAGSAYEAPGEEREEGIGVRRASGAPAAVPGLQGIDTYA